MPRPFPVGALHTAALTLLRDNRAAYTPDAVTIERGDYLEKVLADPATRMPAILLEPGDSPFEPVDGHVDGLRQTWRFALHHFWQLSDTESTTEHMEREAAITMPLFCTDEAFEVPAWWSPPAGIEVVQIYPEGFFPRRDHEEQNIGLFVVPVVAVVNSYRV